MNKRFNHFSESIGKNIRKLGHISIIEKEYIRPLRNYLGIQCLHFKAIRRAEIYSTLEIVFLIL